MPKKSNLPIEVHDHFRKANVLHGYVEKDLGSAKKHAIETGQELLAAKAAIPHGSWEVECDRLFDASARTARFYMQFARDIGALPKRQTTAVLMLEGTLDGTAKLARQAAIAAGGKKPPKAALKAPKPAPDSTPFDTTEGPGTDSGKQEPGPRPPRKGKDRKDAPGVPPKQFERSAWFKQWEQSIGPLVRLVDKIAEGVGEKQDPYQLAAHNALNIATEAISEWAKVKKPKASTARLLKALADLADEWLR